ncbi:MAG: hypothetical protein IT429_04690 [Gemmataceae bacterium]|nr:hypothetical protein [Gemmataceae bacterium]
MRRTLRILIIVACVLLILGLAARWYLSSPAVTHKVEAQLTQLYGGPVEVEAARIGLKESTINGVRLFEAQKAGGQPWLSARSVTADVSLGELLSGGALPRRLAVSGGAVTLRFDANGKLLTRLPQAASPGEGGVAAQGFLPALDLDNSQITLRKQGYPAIVLTDVTLHATPEGGRLALSGSGVNPQWGKLNLTGTVDPQAGSFALTLTSAGTVRVTQAMLDALPLVPPSVWKAVQLQGQTPVTLTVSQAPSAAGTHYRVELQPRGTTVVVPSADLKAARVHGKLIVEDGVVKLRGVRGDAYRGTLALNGDLDFSGDVPQLDFTTIEAKGLDVCRLPTSWGLPRQIAGQLYASGSARVTLGKGTIGTAGDVKAEIRNARIAGQPTDGPIEIELAPAGPPLRVGSADGEGGGDGEGVRIQPPDPSRSPSRVTIKVKLKDANVAQMLDEAGVKLPFPVTGRLSFQGQAALPSAAIDDARAYHFNGHAILKDATIGEVRLQQVEASARYEDGVLKLAPLAAVAAGEAPPGGGAPPTGTLKGQVVVQFAPAGDVTGELTLAHVPLGPLAQEAGLKAVREGEITGSLKVRVSLKRLQERQEWDGEGTLVVQRAHALGWTLEDGAATIAFRGDRLTIDNLHARLEGTPLTGSAELHLKGDYPHRAKLQVTGADLAAVQRLAPAVRPPVSVAGRLTATAEARGTLAPFRIEAAGTAAAKGLKVENVHLQDVRLGWEAQPDTLEVKDLRAELHGGKVAGNAVIPLNDGQPGKVHLTLKGIDAGDLLKGAEIPLPIAGRVDGTVKGTLPPAVEGQERKVNVALVLKAPKLRVQDIAAEALQGSVRYEGGDINYNFEAKTLGGTLEVEGKVPPRGAAPGEGKARLRGTRLALLARELTGPRHLLPLDGTVNADLTFRLTGPGFTPAGDGRVVVNDLRWDGEAWVPRLAANVDLTPERLLVRDLTGSFGQGILRAQLALGLRPPARNWFNISLDGAEASRLLAPWPDLKDAIQGPVQANLRGTLGSQWTARGTVALQRGKVAGVDVIDWRAPLGLVFVPKYGRGRLEIRSSSANLASGRMTGGLTYAWGAERRLEGKVQFANLELRGLVRGLAESSYVGSGKITGRAEFSGPGLSLADLNGGIDATLAQTQALEFPVLRQLSPFLAISTSTSFRSGQLRARLSRGVFRIERLTLAGGPADLFATGTVTTSGRLGLNVRATTQQVGLNANALRLAGIRIPTTGMLPLTVLMELNNYFSNRTLHLIVTGTVRSPTVRIGVRQLLQDEALRFFLRQAGLPQF